ncbi:histidine phosphatase family protein [Sphingomonas sp. RB3P16]|uniref:histidine phosphatase family protein n=1 Tax=Parasphingomonas frigoris TaxID=3096163 RepID=UPI002FCB4C54
MSAPVLLHLLRHGAPLHTGTLLGRTDSPVTAAGLAACVARAEGLAVDAVIASDLIRASACADAIARARGLSAARDPRWRELDFGAWDGLAPASLDQAALGAFWDDPDANPPPDGERWSSLVARVATACAAITAPTLVVTHGGAMRAALSVLCGLGPRESWALDLPYAALLSLRVWRAPAPSAQIVGLVT